MDTIDTAKERVMSHDDGTGMLQPNKEEMHTRPCADERGADGGAEGCIAWIDTLKAASRDLLTVHKMILDAVYLVDGPLSNLLKLSVEFGWSSKADFIIQKLYKDGVIGTPMYPDSIYCVQSLTMCDAGWHGGGYTMPFAQNSVKYTMAALVLNHAYEKVSETYKFILAKEYKDLFIFNAVVGWSGDAFKEINAAWEEKRGQQRNIIGNAFSYFGFPVGSSISLHGKTEGCA